MDSLFVILSIILYIIFSAMNRKAKAAQREAQKKAFQQTTSMGETVPTAPNPLGTPRTSPRRAAQPVSIPVFNARPAPVKPLQTELAEGESAMMEDRQPRMRVMGTSTVSEPVQTMQSQLTEISASSGHTVEVSSISGHAHEETSLSGRFGDCDDPAVSARKMVESAPVPTAAAPLFRFDVGSVRSGLIYAEILGKPKALRGR